MERLPRDSQCSEHRRAGKTSANGGDMLRGLQESRALRRVQRQGQELAPHGVPPPAVVHACLLSVSPWRGGGCPGKEHMGWSGAEGACGK